MSANVVNQNPYRLAWAAVDPVVWVLAVLLARWLRYDFDDAYLVSPGALAVGLGAGVLHVVLGLLLGPYAIGHLRASFEEAIDLTRAVCLTTLVVTLPVLFARPILVPRSVPVIAGAFALMGMLGLRMTIRLWRARRRQSLVPQQRAVVFGAGEAGRLLLRTIVRDRHSRFALVALLDDSPQKARLNIEGVRVRGTRDDLTRVAKRYGATVLIIAVPSADAALLRDLTERGEGCGLQVLVLPAVQDIIGGPTPQDLRDVNLEDLLGRRPIELDLDEIARSVAGRRVLVTGAGGSIGSELCRQLARLGPQQLVMLDRDESALQGVQLSVSGNGLLQGDSIVLADIRDPDALRQAFRRARPDLVFHAAALKHLPLLESHPLEAWKTNVLGTLNVLQACADAGVGTVVNISTDKAADPTCVLGYSKRLAERLTATYAEQREGRYVSVRFGNVLGSRGSVVHAFASQIAQGGPVTVTHPDVERFFMLIPEACQLVLQASVSGEDGQVMVLDMGRPMKIVEVARTLIRMSQRRDVDITFTGLRPGEKLAEDLFSHREDPRPTDHPLVAAVRVPSIPVAEFSTTRHADAAAAVAWMRARTVAGTTSPSPDSRSPATSRGTA